MGSWRKFLPQQVAAAADTGTGDESGPAREATTGGGDDSIAAMERVVRDLVADGCASGSTIATIGGSSGKRARPEADSQPTRAQSRRAAEVRGGTTRSFVKSAQVLNEGPVVAGLFMPTQQQQPPENGAGQRQECASASSPVPSVAPEQGEPPGDGCGPPKRKSWADIIAEKLAAKQQQPAASAGLQTTDVPTLSQISAHLPIIILWHSQNW